MPSHSRRTFLALLATGLILLSLRPSLLAASPPERMAHLTILQLNDVYDVTPVEKGKRGGLARVATLRDRIRTESPNTLFVLAGDFLSPSTMSGIFQGSQMVAVLNAVGLDLATFGNHEFDFGPDVTRQRMQESHFTWVSANVLDPATGLPFGGAVPFVLRQFDGVRVAVFGLTTPETRKLSKGAATLKFLEPIQAARDAVRRARHLKADVTIALTHQDMAEDRQLAAAVPGIDLILGGHEHVPLDARVGRTLILKAGSDARLLGRIDVLVFPGRGGKRVESQWELIPVTDEIPSQPEVAALVKHYADLTAAQLDVVVGATTLPLDTRGEVVRVQESAVGDLIADLMRAALQSEVALINGGGHPGGRAGPCRPASPPGCPQDFALRQQGGETRRERRGAPAGAGKRLEPGRKDCRPLPPGLGDPLHLRPEPAGGLAHRLRQRERAAAGCEGALHARHLRLPPGRGRRLYDVPAGDGPGEARERPHGFRPLAGPVETGVDRPPA